MLFRSTRLRRNVALKILPANVSADEARRRFTQEARAASALNHPDIIGIYDIGSDKGHDFIVMEFVEGEQLRRPLPRKKDGIKRALDVSPVASQTSGNGRRASLIWKVLSLLLVAGAITAAWRIGRNAAVVPRQNVSLAAMTLMPFVVDPDYDGEPTFSPDGQTIAYVTNRTGNFEIFRKQISGGAEINLSQNGADDVQPAFSPDGSLFSRDGHELFNSRARTTGDIWLIKTGQSHQ